MEFKIFHNPDLIGGSKPALERNEVHIWCIEWKEMKHFWESRQSVMSRQELKKAAKFYFYEDRMRYIAGKIMTRLLLMAYLKEREIQFFTGKFGKPYYRPISGTPHIGFNLSHSGNIVLAAFAREMDVGVDVQEMAGCPDAGEIAKNFYTSVEADDVKRGGKEVFFRYWAAKEAYLKAVGTGLNRGMNFFSVRNDRVEENGKQKQHWKLIPVEIAGYAAFVALQEKGEMENGI